MMVTNKNEVKISGSKINIENVNITIVRQEPPLKNEQTTQALKGEKLSTNKTLMMRLLSSLKDIAVKVTVAELFREVLDLFLDPDADPQPGQSVPAIIHVAGLRSGNQIKLLESTESIPEALRSDEVGNSTGLVKKIDTADQRFYYQVVSPGADDRLHSLLETPGETWDATIEVPPDTPQHFLLVLDLTSKSVIRNTELLLSASDGNEPEGEFNAFLIDVDVKDIEEPPHET